MARRCTRRRREDLGGQREREGERNHGEKNSGIEQRGVYAVKERKRRRRGEGMEEWTMGT